MFMNMLVTIIMEHYGTVRDVPENKDIINRKLVEHVHGAWILHAGTTHVCVWCFTTHPHP